MHVSYQDSGTQQGGLLVRCRSNVPALVDNPWALAPAVGRRRQYLAERKKEIRPQAWVQEAQRREAWGGATVNTWHTCRAEPAAPAAYTQRMGFPSRIWSPSVQGADEGSCSRPLGLLM